MADEDEGEMDMAAAMAADPELGPQSDDDEGELDMAAAMAADPSLGAPSDDDEGELDMAAAMAADSSLGPQSDGGDSDDIGPLVDVPAIHGVSLEASAILGTALMPVSQLLKMGRGAVVELDKSIGDMIDISINDQMVARGEVMIKEDRLCIEITEMVKRISS